LSRWMAAGAAVVLVGLLVVYVSRVGFAWLAFESGSRAQAQQNLSQAIAGYQVAIALDSGKALYRSALAAAYFQAFEKTQDEAAAQAALSELESAIALNPLDGRLHGLLGHVYLSLAKSGVQGQLRSQKTTWLKAARAAYERAMALEPYSVFHRLELGRILWALGDRGGAQIIVEQAVAMEPNFLPGREWLARRYLSDGRLEMARYQYQEILDRQNRYAGWTRDFVEEQFMKVDPMDLKKALEKRSALS
jgi:tetratricopeptide (TPR) repeat protein